MTTQQTFGAVMLWLFACTLGQAQSSRFSTAAFEEIQEESREMTAAELSAAYPVPDFQTSVNLSFEAENYVSVAETALELTVAEKRMLRAQGFVVSERLAQRTFLEQFLKVWRKDVPVFVSADVVLRAFHYSYVDLLNAVELELMKPMLDEFLAKSHAALPRLADQYAGNRMMEAPLRDVDVYLSVARSLLAGNESLVKPFFPESEPIVVETIDHVMQHKLAAVELFSSEPRPFDFSQFRPRGHYAAPRGRLAGYFRAMAWLGRCGFVVYGDPDASTGFPELSSDDLRRQATVAAMLVELMEMADASSSYDDFVSQLDFFIGPADCLDPKNLSLALDAAEIQDPTELLAPNGLQDVGLALHRIGAPAERITSRIVSASDKSSEQRSPAYVFSIFGQRFSLDSYVLSNVVHGRVEPKPGVPKRMFPSTQDLLFALGNNESANLLQEDLGRYKYTGNLVTVRRLIDRHPAAYWDSSVYASWLDCIRCLNPPETLEGLPEFMRTRQWWHQKMNTQLASWTQLRHDHLLYAKSSYTDTAGCSYPHGFVEPFPDLYRNLNVLGKRIEQKVLQLREGKKANAWKSLLSYAKHLQSVTQMLESISRKELNDVPLDDKENKFLDEVIVAGGYGVLRGWYINLIAPDYSGDAFLESNYKRLRDYIVADYHTTPSDALGNEIGAVLHAGTGKADMAIVAVRSCDGKTIAYAGPVMSYYEYQSEGFQRLTDDEWTEKHLAEADRPAWTGSFLIHEQPEKPATD